jgi:tetratricopeptide (TPR) repeat protein
LAWLAGIAAAQAIGLFSKENAVVLPGVMLAYDLTWFDRTTFHRTTWRRRAPAYAALALPFAAFFYLRAQAHLHMVVPFTDSPLADAGFWTARLTAFKAIGKFLWLFLWPARLSADYSYNAVPLFGWRAWTWEDAKALIGLAVCLGAALVAVVLAVRGRRAEKPMLFFLGFFFVAISPTSNLMVFIGSIMAERFLYLPSVGLAGCVVAAIYALGRQTPLRQTPQTARVACAALSLVCVALAARTYVRNQDWKDELSLWTSAVTVSPGDAKAHYNLANTLEILPGRLPEAIAEYRAALRIDPNHADVHYNLANALSAIPGRLPEAIAEYQAALRVEPDRVEAHNNLANALARLPGRLPEAMAEYRAALRLKPDSVGARIGLANALSAIPGGLPEAVAEYEEAVRIRPDDADAHYDLGTALARIPGRLPEAIAEFEAALRSDPDFVEAHVNLGTALAQTPGGLRQAITEYEAALRIRPDPLVRQMLNRLRAGQAAAPFR